jgi:anthranilate phosphoribosyltransferase
MTINDALCSLRERRDLSSGQMSAAMEEIMAGRAETKDIVEFLTLLRSKGETPHEVAAAVTVMRRHARRISVPEGIILDTCGTGGDNKHTFNISTAVAFIAAGAGVLVAKHGNRAVSSTSGSADVLEALGIDISMEPDKAGHCLKAAGIAFLFAQVFHPAMKFAMPARRQIGSRTLFNIVGPLSNPARATHQLVGVFDKEWAHIVAQALLTLGSIHALVVCGNDGLDELSLSDTSVVYEVVAGEVRTHEISPEDAGLERAAIGQIAGGSAQDNARMLLEIFEGRKGPLRDIVVLNAAAALYAAGEPQLDFKRAVAGEVARAQEVIDSGKALEKVRRLQQFSQKG